jgi:hypothetical protein
MHFQQDSSYRCKESGGRWLGFGISTSKGHSFPERPLYVDFGPIRWLPIILADLLAKAVCQEAILIHEHGELLSQRSGGIISHRYGHESPGLSVLLEEFV